VRAVRPPVLTPVQREADRRRREQERERRRRRAPRPPGAAGGLDIRA
jgi:hypothetical protein